jgi:hypothetical protein
MRHTRTDMEARAALLALGAGSLLTTGADGPGLFWPLLGIGLILAIAIIVSRVVRGDPSYDRGRDWRNNGSGPVLPFGDDGGPNGHF